MERGWVLAAVVEVNQEGRGMREAPRQGLGIRAVAAIGVASAALGALVMYLYAPAAGRVTRKQLALKFRRFRQTAGRRFAETQRTLSRRAAGWIVEHLPHETNGHRRAARRRTIHQATVKA